MAINPTTMATEIVGKVPAAWQTYWVDGQAPKEWVNKLVLDVVTMWTSVILVGGTGPPPSGSYPHTHAVSVPIVPSSTNMGTLTYSTEASTMFTTVAAQLAAHLTSNLAVAQSDGAISHDHTIAYPSGSQSPFAGLGATASTMKTSIVSALNSASILGAAMPNQGNQNSLDLIFAAISEGILEHMEDNGQLSFAVGAGHLHTLS